MKKNREWRVESCPGVEKRDEGGTFLRKEEKKRETKKKRGEQESKRIFSCPVGSERERERGKGDKRGLAAERSKAGGLGGFGW